MRKFRKNGNVVLTAGTSVDADYSGSLTVNSPFFELKGYSVDVEDHEVIATVLFYEQNRNSNPAARIFTFTETARINNGTLSLNDVIDLVLGINELNGAIEQ